jgi:hypothetical protein
MRILSGRKFPTEEHLRSNYFCLHATQILFQTLNRQIERVLSCDSNVVLGEQGAKCLVHRHVHRGTATLRK